MGDGSLIDGLKPKIGAPTHLRKKDFHIGKFEYQKTLDHLCIAKLLICL